MKKKKSYFIVISCIVFSLFIASSILYMQYLKQSLHLETKTYLEEIAIQSSDRIKQKMNSNFELLNSLSIEASKLSEHDDLEKSRVLDKWCEKSVFSRMVYSDLKGNAITSDGYHIDISNRNYFKDNIKGRERISEVLKDGTGEFNDIIVFSVPVYSEHKITGVLIGLYDTQKISEIITFDFFKGKGYEYIITNDGHVVTQPDWDKFKDNLFDVINQTNDKSVVENLKQSLNKNQVGVSTFMSENGEKIYISYAPIIIPRGLQQLNAITVVPYDVVLKQSQQIIPRTIAIICLMSLIYLCIVIYILRINKKNKNELEKIAYYDEMCGVRNRTGFSKDTIDKLKNTDARFVGIHIDVDKFKLVNDMFGFEYGNEILQIIADILKNIFGEDAIIGRFSGDHFGICTEYKTTQEVEDKVSNLFEQIEEKCSNRTEIIISAGIYFIDDNSESFDQIFDKANIAKDSVKYLRKSRYKIYDEELVNKIKEENWLTKELKKAIERKDFEVYYQPKFELSTNKIIASEALIRWNHPVRGFISPQDFIPWAEKTQLIIDIGHFVFDRVCSDISRWRAMGLECLPVSFNASRVELYQFDFLDFIKSTVEKYDIDYKVIELEITETTAVNDYENIKDLLEQIKSLGISISIDDFGSGYSSLGCLQKFKVDILKLDRSFLLNLEADGKGLDVLKGMIDLSKRLGLKTICEGIETQEHLKLLDDLHCGYGQGFIFAKPMAEIEFRKFITKKTDTI